jgi:hypothetical protein
MSEVVPIREDKPEPVYKASDIVTTITISMEVAKAQIHFQTHLLRDAPDAELRANVNKLFACAEWQRAKTNVMERQALIARAEKDLSRFRRVREDYIRDCEHEWTIVGQRKGDLILTGSQEAQLRNQDTTIQQRIDEITEQQKLLALDQAILDGTQ